MRSGKPYHVRTSFRLRHDQQASPRGSIFKRLELGDEPAPPLDPKPALENVESDMEVVDMGNLGIGSWENDNALTSSPYIY